ncbi:hypothetical protein [Paenibacillus pedocola]|uniref:hypothetical protein n=1 Tax=Paenibacillus pedocola TaxID=3242193 RepID=UPI00287732C1|nr:hypothetical protein [Paenibacillus typhae]
MKKISLFTLVLLFMLNALAIPAGAASTAFTSIALPDTAFTSGGIYAPSVTPLKDNQVLLLNRNADESSTVQVLDTSLHTVLWSRTLKVYDLAVVNVSQKIVLITEEKKAIKKIVFGYNGMELSSDNYHYALKLPTNNDNESFYIRWSAPSGNVPERIAIVSSEQFQLFQSPWKTSAVKYNLKMSPSDAYENIQLADIKYPGYPYVVAEYNASGIGTTTYLLRVINLYTKQEYSIPFDSKQRLGGHNIQYQISGKDLLVGTSHEERMGASIISPEAPQPTFYRYQLATGKLIQSLTAKFVSDQDVYGWTTELLGNTLFVQDLNNNSWSLYDTKGTQTVLASGEQGASPLILLKVNDTLRSVTLLASKGNGQSEMITVKY